jgi:hypothetical protein
MTECIEHFSFMVLFLYSLLPLVVVPARQRRQATEAGGRVREPLPELTRSPSEGLRIWPLPVVFFGKGDVKVSKFCEIIDAPVY